MILLRIERILRSVFGLFFIAVGLWTCTEFPDLIVPVELPAYAWILLLAYGVGR